MIFASLALAAALYGEPTVKWTATRATYVKGAEFPVKVELSASTAEELPVWMAEPAGFSVNGKPLGKRSSARLQLAAGAKLTLEFDLAPALAEAGAGGREFKLGYADGKGGPEISVSYFEAAPAGLDFMKMEPAELANYQVLMTTNRGLMRFEMWPDVAPGHVRNFLDLSYTKFYDGTLFHRVGPGFMIQGGDPNTKSANPGSWGTGNGPRMLKAEFSTKHHEKGVLSMARGTDNDSASCQFFVMHGVNPGLDGKYSVFGKLLDGNETLDAIAKSPGSGIDQATVRPREPQKILSALVIRAPAK
jgi:peptidyl-prolyl cis-trans isomerase B (cyclophilin B)